ncbi:MAG: hypothetical protein AAF798_11820 [Bacteroidota bacterium]
MSYSAVIGQAETISLLHQFVEQDRLPHALLLVGPKGCGKLALAITAAQQLLCENKTETGDACGRCRACIKSHKLIHPDLHFSFPTVGTNVTSDTYLGAWREALLDNPYLNINQWLQLIGAENKQGNINKQECNAIIKKLSLKTFENNYKVLIMWLPEFLGKEGNRLLKIIEEPPANTHFILVAERTELILNTILSRCQLVKVTALSDKEVIAGLQQKGVGSLEEAQQIAYLANGNFNEALSLMKRQQANETEEFLAWLRLCYQGNGIKIVNWVNTFAKKGREPQKLFFQYALHFLREYFILKTDAGLRLRLQEAEIKTAENLKKIIAIEQIEAMMELFSESIYYIERNANPKVLLLDTSLQLNQILKMPKTVSA